MSTLPPSMPLPPARLESLPTEIHLQIFSHLNVCDSTCLGLTNKKLYQIHYTNYGRVGLLQQVGDRYLYKAIRNWMLPVWVWDPLPSKFRKEESLSGFDRWRLYGREEDESREEEEEDGDSEREEESTPNTPIQGGENKEDNEGTSDDGRKKKAGGDGNSRERVKKVHGYTPQQYAELLRLNQRF